MNSGIETNNADTVELFGEPDQLALAQCFVGEDLPQEILACHAQALHPATHTLYEWREYWLRCPGADCLRVGTEEHRPQLGHFRLRFENELGLTTLRAYAGGRRLGEPLHVEVLSGKLQTVDAHLSFYQGLLDDLFARAARLPFIISSHTSRGVTEAQRPPDPLFALHFFCQYARTLSDALAIIQAAPHRRLHDHPTPVPLAEVTEADADVLLSILQAPQEWAPARGFALAQALGGYAPVRVWQRLPEETSDTPENRFVLAFLRQALVAAEGLPAQRWWGNVPPERQRLVREVAGLLRQAISLPPFDEVGPLQRLPFTSQVLLRRDGYREMLDLWQVFQQARRPLFGALQHAIEVRDIALLYEMWAFFALVEEIAVVFRESPVIAFDLADERGLDWKTEARFGQAGSLAYNRTFGHPMSYSLPLRPDFTWMVAGKPLVVLDAKFRLERAALVQAEASDDEETPATPPTARATREDLYKMHTYRDALGVRAAVAVYPGDGAVFYDRHSRARLAGFGLCDLLRGEYCGIGALPMRPDQLMKGNP